MWTRIIAGLLFCGSCGAQPWAGIIASNRATDWSVVGASITHRTTQCGSTISAYSGSAATINTAITNCTSGQYVQLGAGTFSLTSGITFGSKNNVTLRGMGPNQTILTFTGSVNCNGFTGAMCVSGGYTDISSPPNTGNWTSGLAQNTSTITLSSVTGLNTGDYLILDQTNDTVGTDTGYVFVCQDGGNTCTVEGGGGGWARSNRGQQQVAMVTGVSGNNVTISPPVIMPNWSAGKSPQGFWTGNAPRQGNGIESLRINNLNSGAQYGIVFMGAYNCWVRNIMSTWSNRSHITNFQSLNITIRDSYFYAAQNAASQSYGIELSTSSAILVENNIIHRHAGTYMVNGASPGSVAAYNLMFDFRFTGEMQYSNYLHESGNDMMLHEGNVGNGIRGDVIHGTHNLNTIFRNRFNGIDGAKNGAPIYMQPYSRIMNVIGNVLGTAGTHTTYGSIYSLGTSPFISTDSQVAATMFRWGNYDTANATVRWEASEVPSGIAQYANSVPASQTLPASFYLPARPDAWWGTPSGTPSWPPIGPDVTGGDVSGYGGHVNKIPAQLCYDNGTKDGDGVLTNYNGEVCYVEAAGGTAPTVTTTTASSVTATSASSGGNVTADGGAAVTTRGVCYATTANPTTPCTSNGTGTGSFTSSLTSLSASTTYHYRAFATNSFGTAYGSDLTFTTGTPPTITTSSLPGGTVGVAYSQTLEATGDTPITWSVTVGSLPDGLSLDTGTGEISGTPTTAATINFTVTATNATGDDSQALSIVITVSPGKSRGRGKTKFSGGSTLR